MKRKIQLTKVIISILIVIAIIILIIIATNAIFKTNNKIIFSSQYKDIVIKGVDIHYDEKTESTNLNLKILNISNEDLTYDSIIIAILDENGNVITTVEQIIGLFEANSEYFINASLTGNFENQVKKIELQAAINQQ